MKAQPIVTLTQVQEDAITYLLRSKRPNALRVKRKACRMVSEFCHARGYTFEESARAVRDMLDVYGLEKNAE